MAQQATWNNHPFNVYLMSGNWNEVSGIYIFAGVNAQNQWVALYIGQAASFAQRLPNHERYAEAVRLGATHVHAMVVPDQTLRNKIELDLIQRFQPRLNAQGR